MLFLLLAININSATEITNYGFLNINSDPLGFRVYLEGDSLGITPIKNYLLKPGEYSVSLFSSDTIESKYWNLSNGNIGSKYSAILDLIKVGAATQRVVVKPNQTSEVFFSKQKINRAPTKVKIATACCIGTGFSAAFLIGFLVANLDQ